MAQPGFTKLMCVAAAGLAAFAGSPVVAEPEQIGTATVIQNEVTAGGDGAARRRLQKDDGIHRDEVIEVATDAKGELKFKDQTVLALGPGARVVLDKFVYDPGKPNGEIVLNLIKGTFRFVTGLSSKPSYMIKTPTASIAVRGTEFNICIRPNGATWVLLDKGQVRVCAPGQACRGLAMTGKIMRVTPDGQVQRAVSWPQLPGHETTTFAAAFPFAQTGTGVPATPRK